MHWNDMFSAEVRETNVNYITYKLSDATFNIGLLCTYLNNYEISLGHRDILPLRWKRKRGQCTIKLHSKHSNTSRPVHQVNTIDKIT